MKKFLYTLTVIAFSLPSFSQTRRLVVMGSSTAEGQAANPHDSCYARLLSHYYKNQLGILDTVYNIALGGTSVYHGMPSTSTYYLDQTRPQPDPLHNVTLAVNLLSGLSNPANGVIIVNYPTNEFLSYDITHIMKCFRIIYDSATRLGNRCYITTTQPRNEQDYGTSWGRKKLAEVKDSVLLEFGAIALNFWDGMYNPADTTIRDIYHSGDGRHFNNKGHLELYTRVLAKDIFPASGPLPLVWGDFTTIINDNQVQLKWSTLQEENTASFMIEHSTDGHQYKAIATIPAKGHSNSVTRYSFNHIQPNPQGYNFYRIKQLDIDEKAVVSAVRIVQFKDRKGIMVRISPNPVANVAQVEIHTTDINLNVIDANGRIVRRVSLQPGLHPIDMQGLAAGAYHIVVQKKGKWIETHDIIKL